MRWLLANSEIQGHNDIVEMDFVILTWIEAPYIVCQAHNKGRNKEF